MEGSDSKDLGIGVPGKEVQICGYSSRAVSGGKIDDAVRLELVNSLSDNHHELSMLFLYACSFILALQNLI